MHLKCSISKNSQVLSVKQRKQSLVMPRLLPDRKITNMSDINAPPCLTVSETKVRLSWRMLCNVSHAAALWPESVRVGERVRMRVRHSVRTCTAAVYTVYILRVMRDDASRSCFGDMRKSNLRNASGAVQQSSSGTVEEKSDFEERETGHLKRCSGMLTYHRLLYVLSSCKKARHGTCL